MPLEIAVLDANEDEQTVATNDAIIAKLPAALGTNGGMKIESVAPGLIALSGAPAVTADDPYDTGDVVGGIVPLAGAVAVAAGAGRIKRIVIRDASGFVNIAVLYRFFFFMSVPTGPFADKTPFVFGAGDLAKATDVVVVTGMEPDTAAAGLMSVECDRPFKLPAGTTLWVVPVCKGTPDFENTTDFSFTVFVEPA